LRPEPIPTLDPRGDYLTRVWRDGVYPLAEELGVTMRLPPMQPRSRLAHEAAKWAATVNRFDDYNEAVFRAFFERGENIGEIGVLIKFAEDLKIDAEDLRLALTRGEFEAQVLADEREAAALGVHAIPAFVANRRMALSGVQAVSALEAMLDRAI
jgi:predicted DsbA family dithiol-disulfide isomerase